jgi:type I restriction enzyme, S subunit
MTAARLLEHFDRVAEAPEGVLRLRRFIRDLAVHGKLVDRDPSEDGEPTSSTDDVGGRPFDVPAHWRWATVAESAEARLGKMLDKAKNRGTRRRYLRNINVRWFGFDLSDLLEMPFETGELDELALREGDVLICEGGEPGRAAVWDQRNTDILFQKAIHRVRFRDAINPHYFVNVLRASADNGLLERYFTGVTFKHLTGRGLASFLFPVPPIGEQNRIVAKVDELMALCDRLETVQAEREVRRVRLLESLLQETLDGQPQMAQDQ